MEASQGPRERARQVLLDREGKRMEGSGQLDDPSLWQPGKGLIP